jgi:hypothetical protein
VVHKSIRGAMERSGLENMGCSTESKWFKHFDGDPAPVMLNSIKKLDPGHYVICLSGEVSGSGETAKMEEGHAIGLHKREDGSYALLEPNAGEFVFTGEKELEAFLIDLADKGGYAKSFRGMIPIAIQVGRED